MVHALNGALAIRLKLVGAPFSPFDFFPLWTSLETIACACIHFFVYCFL